LPGLKRAKIKKKTHLKDRKLGIKSLKINLSTIKMFIVTLFSLKFNIIFYFFMYTQDLDLDPHSFPQLDPDPHSPKKLDPDPDSHKVNADPKH
jgi:hypothetical protein